MAYTPELSQEGSSILRRIAWMFNLPMTRTIEIMVEQYAKNIDSPTVCGACRDKTKCSECLFQNSKSK